MVDPTGFEPATSRLTVEVTDLIHHWCGKLVCRGTGETGVAANRAQGASLSRFARTRVTTPLARAPPRYAIDLRREPQKWSGLWSEVSELFTTDKAVSRGTDGAALLVWQNEEIRAFTTWTLKILLCVQPTFPIRLGTAKRLETKTPPEHRLGRGSITRTCGTASGHSASARKHTHVAVPLAPSGVIQRLHDE